MALLTGWYVESVSRVARFEMSTWQQEEQDHPFEQAAAALLVDVK